MTNIELEALDLHKGKAVFFVMADGFVADDFIVKFRHQSYWEDTSFSHAFGVEKDGHWEVEIELTDCPAIYQDAVEPMIYEYLCRA